MTRAAWVRIIPFAVFMAFIGLQQGLEWLGDTYLDILDGATLLYLYPVKILVVTALIVYFWREYSELDFADLKQFQATCFSIVLGLIVFALWIHMDWDLAVMGDNASYDPSLINDGFGRNLLIAIRLAGAALLVPVMEELFWRSFLLRYIIDADFSAVRIGTYSLSSFLIGAVLFGLEHHLVFAGIMAGMAYSLLLYRTKSIAQCTLSHAVTNLALGIYVLSTGAWQFW